MVSLATKSQKIDMTLTLCAVIVMSVYLYGFYVLFMLVVTIAAALVFDYLCNLFLGRKKGERLEYNSVLTAVVFVLCLSAVSPWWVAVYGMLFSIVVAKFPFGGTGRNIFNPAAVGLAFCAVSFPKELFTYPAAYTKVQMLHLGEAAVTASPGAVLQSGGNPSIDTLNTLLANYSGPLGATAIILLLACGLYLIIRKTISLRIVLSAAVAFSVLVMLFPRSNADAFHTLSYELMSGIFVFALFFMASDPVTSPRTDAGKILFGLFIGAGTVFALHVSGTEFSVLFPLLLANALVPAFDRAGSAISLKLAGGKEPLGDEHLQEGGVVR